MYEITRTMFLSVLTPLHAGGSTRLSIIDQPIQREGHTGFPKIEASSLKGSIRHAFENNADGAISKDSITITQIFGADDQDKIVASAASFSDARLLFFPVRSAKGVFAFVTCPMVLKRFADDMNIVGMDDFSRDFNFQPDKLPLVTPNSKLLIKKSADSPDAVILEEFLYNVSVEKGEASILTSFINKLLRYLPENELLKSMLPQNTIVVSDEDFADFVRLSTEVITRIKIENDTGIVKDGALFNEEYLPSESILYSLIFITSSRQPKNSNVETLEPKKEAAQIAKEIEDGMPTIFQVGANMTLGKGFVACNIVSGGERHV
ncbi:type III-B CRISPR module RAMP protein Cmr4 [Desulfosporosinus shakirovi]|uniref:type III-B CRISPR module RAMP protein Cmr4 n=1 Tax=Desulfosporosinus shakirovi TaxID=2885154 RepID=UPI001E38E405|nr:type III-B CRISPR module RAMP protein Cmr4 [Desulfosporosinus sp. SRJS8]MCB8818362.1 type III-B CRISPR module RAMP protein Cmr4 [Desulfosporosinus sp. SRJS8]